ncbi:unnamed protein product (macronuclear) [Paramecium tetraurelia]|uniref:EGF-like domain-containing protein n=1 Tax=Paramecium tetraurelia TaxID=5888 RepID=A0DWP5_PARTE|nr:uncharacterized protein GSPATT00021105001 [Paramecium tetraurelia]CAK87462.1 unnamed protein product [Paramecium tetraurelia]|eukprot:XP_001454859.1 hypothetical protein (macronuclear) [Paramecium tetraurelia strain d4-2]
MSTSLYHLVLFGFLVSTHCQIKVSEACKCQNLLSQNDCQQNTKCSWLNKSCQEKPEEQAISTKPESIYCKGRTQEDCSNKIGCAYYNQNCIHFSGCTSYVYTTHNECQLISTQCTSDGIQCIKPRECFKNEQEQLCSTVISSSGSRKCVWEDKVCRDQTCNEASQLLITDDACDSFIKGCVTNGRGCVDKRGNCYYYDKNCDGMIGSDGLCEQKGDKCQSKDCANAPLTYYADQQCQSFRKGCRTTGIGCTDQALKSCNTYTGDGEQCLKYIGSSGKCEEGGVKVHQNNILQMKNCKSYSSKCKTTGIGCVAILLNCNSYTGTKNECERRIGADGRCTAQNTEESQQCKARICSDGQFSTDSECGQYQFNCISNGVECTSFLISCNKYKGDAEKCNKYRGTEGKCKIGENGYCALNVCENAEFKTNQECKSVQSYCLTNGTKCVTADTCPNTQQQVTCLASDKCQWAEQCVTNECRFFLTKGTCLGHSSNVECFWEGSGCADKKCKHAGQQYRSNKDCQLFLPLMYLQWLRMQYVGDEDTCTYYKGSNGKVPCLYYSATQKCRSKICQDNKSASTQKECDDTMEGCKFTGSQGCVNENAECGEFYGNSQQCYALNSKCSQNLGESGKCRPLECYDNSVALEDYECNLFKSGCVTKGLGCIASTAPCTQYSGNSIDACSKFVGNGKKCWYDQGFSGQCVDKQCTHNTDAQNDQECDKFLYGCVFNGKGCQDAVETCNTYEGDEDTCSKYRGNGLLCVRIDYCEDRKCSDVQNPLSLKECEEYLSICAFDGGKCIEKQDSCDYYYGYSQEQCQILVNVDRDQCIYGDNDQYCTNRKCKDAQNVKSQQDCTSYRKNCIFNGDGKCVEWDSCSNYSDFSEQGCQDAKDKTGKGCWSDQNRKCKDRTCLEVLNEYSNEICQAHDSSCIFTGSKCIKKLNNCSDYDPKIVSDSECKLIPGCWWSSENKKCKIRECSDNITTPSDENCRSHLETCRFNGDKKCVDEKDKCSDYVSFNASGCKEVTNKKKEKCWYTEQSSTCADRSCSDNLQFYSAEICQEHLSTCRYNGFRCQDAKDTCIQYIGFSKEACTVVTTKTNQYCWYQGQSSICVNASCENEIQDPSPENCQKHLATCRFNGTRCISERASCNNYLGSNQVCQGLTDASNNQCWYNIRNTSGLDNNCILKECSNLQHTYSLDICEKYIVKTVNNKQTPNCTYDGIKCITIQNYCSQYFGFSSEQCLNVTTLSGETCFQDPNNNSMQCRARICSDNQTALNDLQCDQFLKGCVTSGRGCTDSTQPCNTFRGTQSSCLRFVGNQKKCRGQNLTTRCSVRECFHDQQSTTDIECNSYLDGCVTNGKGCISSLEPCSSYVGNLQTCSKFKGNGRLCYSDSLVDIHVCRDRQCSDNLDAVNDSDCNTFLPGCVNKGSGCIEDTKPCSSYYGTQAQCSKFKGEKGTKPCWNFASASNNTSCIDRECSHITRGTNTIECNSFLEGCVSDGFQCLTKRNCSQFYGTVKTCMLFDAIDKPCKGVDETMKQCKQLQCFDAPNNYNTDEKCNQFKPGCKTTGYGCIDNRTCEMISSSQLCKERPDCQFIQGCLNTIKVCMQITKYSQCLMNSNMKCSWDFQTKSCRDWICSDASVLLKQHEECQALNQNCTTTGNGCIEISHCNQYQNKLTCLSAISLGYSKKCVWELDHAQCVHEPFVCRDKDCKDAPSSYNEDLFCYEISPHCVTSGKGCTYKEYSCEDLLTKTKCTQDYQGKSCLWMNLTQTCVTFSQCSDVKKTTLSECQQYSEQCTSNGINCISYQKCSEYTNSTSCKKGTDGECGWVIEQLNQEPKCQIFQMCSDILGSTKENCQQYSDTCTSDGQNCIEIGNCQSYKTKYGCNSSGIDGPCFWNESQSPPVCRLQQCVDIPLVPYMTYQYCSTFNPKLNCTTNTIYCVDKKLCSSYSEQECYEGTDGPCVFAIPLKQSSGTKQCRAKDCTDYIETTTEACSKLQSGCISNGFSCLNKLNCSEYTTETSCDSDGIDGICVFEGQKCSKMTQCEDANNSLKACSKKSKVCHFTYEQTSNTNNDTNNTKCTKIECRNSPNCSPVLSFDESQVTVCIQKSKNECVVGLPHQLSESRCYIKSHSTYRWNPSTLKCEKCVATQVTNETPHEDSFQLLFTSIILMLIIVAI